MAEGRGEPVFPYEGFRRGQREVAEEVARTVTEGGLLVLKAPTGFGKTAAVIYGLLLGGAERVLYLVRTVNEIDPVVRELKRFREDFTILFSPRRACPLMSSPGSPPVPAEDFWGNCKLARLKGLCKYYEKLMDEGAVSARDRLRLAPFFSAVRLAWDIAKYEEVCPFFALREMIEDSRFIVATYPYYFKKDIFEQAFEGYDYNDFVVVVDEAHSLMESHSLLEYSISAVDLRVAAKEAERYASEAKEAIERLNVAAGIIENLVKNTGRGPKRVDKEKLKEVLGDPEPYSDLAEQVRLRRLEEALTSGGGLSMLRVALSRVSTWVSLLYMNDTFLFVEKREKGLSIATVAPLDPAVVVREPLERARAAILMSGTIPPIDFAGTILGVNRNPTRFLDAVLHFGAVQPSSNLYVAVATDVTTEYKKRGPEVYKKISSYVAEIHSGIPGATLAVYPSYEVMNQVVARLSIDSEMIVEERVTSLDEVEAMINAASEDILVNAVAGGKLVEGVEFVDYEGKNVLRKVVVVGVPFPQPDEYTKTRLEVLSKRIQPGEARKIVFLYSAIIKVLQAIGRSVRSPDERAATFLLDYRFVRRDIKGLLGLRYSSVFRGESGLQKALLRAREFLTLT